MAANITPPKKVVAHGWWTNEGQKISKSLGNVIDPVKLIEEFGLDQVRYFLISGVPFGGDGNYSRSAMINKVNSELSNKIGNLAQRSLSMIFKNCEQTIPPISEYQPADDKLLEQAYRLAVKMEKHFANCEYDKAVSSIIDLAEAANIYVDQQAPWNLKKTDIMRMNHVLAVLTEVVRIIAIALQPFVPASADKLLNTLRVAEDQRLISNMTKDSRLKSGHKIAKPEGIFPRFEEA